MPVLKNPHWEDYAQARAKGMSQRKAYRAAYPSSEHWKDTVVDSKASDLERSHGSIVERYNELKTEAANAAGGAVLTRKEKREMLAQMARDENLSIRERQSAIDMDNKMEDEYTTRLIADVSYEDRLRKLAGGDEY